MVSKSWINHRTKVGTKWSLNSGKWLYYWISNGRPLIAVLVPMSIGQCFQSSIHSSERNCLKFFICSIRNICQCLYLSVQEIVDKTARYGGEVVRHYSIEYGAANFLSSSVLTLCPPAVAGFCSKLRICRMWHLFLRGLTISGGRVVSGIINIMHGCETMLNQIRYLSHPHKI